MYFRSCLLLKWSGECSKTAGTCGPFLAGVVQMYCIALQSRWHSTVSTAVGVSSRKLPRTESLSNPGLILHTLLMKRLLCFTVSCTAVICGSFYVWESWLGLNVTTEDQLEYCVSVFVVLAGFYSVNSSVTPMNCSHTWKEKIFKQAVAFFNFLLDVGLPPLLCVRTHDRFLCWMAVSVGFYHVLSPKGLRTHFIWRHAGLWIRVQINACRG